ncbi:hypothetical protein [Aeropyrum camini]|uniref:hypothetical protein n=1 Tax=Aeropyrum camini TaxID=229980 RepID=UPI0012E2E92E|nr:hypothetical protein [Aeropyrum camini]
MEAVRRVEALERGHSARGRRVQVLLVALAIASTALGLHGDPEAVLNWVTDRLGGIVALPLAFILLAAFFLSPLAPAILVSTVSTALAGGQGAYILLARLPTRLLPRLFPGFTASSALKMRDRMAASSRVMALAFAALISFALAHGFALSLEETVARLARGL